MSIKPTRGIGGCFARAIIGHAAAPPRAAMNVRRFFRPTDIRFPPRADPS
jgi:hypothetical protein